MLSPIAAGIGGLGRQIGELNELHETTAVAVDASKAQAALENKWAQIKQNTDPNKISEAAEKFFNDDVSPTLDGIGGDDLGSRAAQTMKEKTAANLKAHFSVITAADQAEIIGQAAKDNLAQGRMASSASIQQDPMAFGSAMALRQDVVDGLPGLNAAQKAAIHREDGKEFSVAAVLGYAQHNLTDQARVRINNGDFDDYLDAQEKQTLLTHLTAVDKSKMADDRAAAEYARLQAKQEAEKARSQIVSNVGVDASGHLAMVPGQFTDALKIKDPEVQESTLNFLRSVQSAQERPVPIHSDTTTKDDLMARLYLPDTDPNHVTLGEIQQKFSQQLLAPSDFKMMRSEIDDAKDPAYKMAKSQFQVQVAGLRKFITQSNALTGTGDSYGDQKWGEFQSAAQQMFSNGFKAGTKADAIYEQVKALIPAYQPYRNLDETIKGVTSGITEPRQPMASGVRPPFAAPASKPNVTYKPGMSLDDLDKQLSGGK